MRDVLREIFQTIILAVIIFILVQLSFQNFKVDGASMEPTVQAEERILVNKLVYLRFDRSVLRKFLPFIDASENSLVHPFHSPRRGEIVVFRFPLDPSRNFIKRVIGVSGDTIEIRFGEVFVNGVSIKEPYVRRPDSSSLSPMLIPPGHYFVLGDNRAASNDSRRWGFVPEENTLGKAWFSYWPISSWGFIKNSVLQLAGAD